MELVKKRESTVALVEVGHRHLSVHGWRQRVVEEHLLEHTSAKLSERWCSVGCMARIIFGRSSEANRQRVRQRLPRLFRILLNARRFLVIEYSQDRRDHGKAMAFKLLGAEGIEREELHAARYQIDRMARRRELTGELLTIARHLAGDGVPESSDADD